MSVIDSICFDHETIIVALMQKILLYIFYGKLTKLWLIFFLRMDHRLLNGYVRGLYNLIGNTWISSEEFVHLRLDMLV